MIAENLAKLRKQKELTQKELSEQLNYSDKVISKWERGESKPNVEALQSLSDFYKVSIDEIINGNGYKEESEVYYETFLLDTRLTDGPDFVKKFWILIPLAILIAMIWQGPEVFFPSLIFFFIFQLIWSIQQARVTIEADYNGNKIKIVNRVRKCELMVNNQIVDGIYSIIVFNPSLSCNIGEDTIKVKIDNSFNIKCKIFVNKKHII